MEEAINNKVTVTKHGDSISINIPMKLKRRSGRKEIVIPQSVGDSKPPIERTVQAPVIAAIARAQRWQELLDNGVYKNISDLARAFNVDGSYVGRILRLTLLAPDIIQTIVEGREPDGLSLNRLFAGYPLIWDEQRHFLGFTN